MLRNTDGEINGGREYGERIAVARLNLILDAAAQIGAPLIHGQENPAHCKGRIDPLTDRFDDFQSIGHILHCQIMRLHRNDSLVRSGQGVDGQQIHAVAAVDQNVVVPVLKICQNTGHDQLAGGTAAVAAPIAAAHLQSNQPAGHGGQL